MSADGTLKVRDGGSMVLMRQPNAPFDRQDVGRRLAAAANVPVYDALNVLARHHGAILADSLDPDVARRWAADLQMAGLPAAVLHAHELVTPVYLSHVLSLNYGSDRLHVGTEKGPVDLPWGSVEVISVGHVEVVTERHVVDISGDGMTRQDLGAQNQGVWGGGYIPRPTALSPHVEKLVVVEVYTSERGQTLSMQAKTMTYTHLGDRMQPSSTENMRVTVRDLVQHAPQATRTPAVEVFCQGGVLGGIHYHDMDTFQQEAVWLLQARRQGWLGGSARPPLTRFDALEL